MAKEKASSEKVFGGNSLSAGVYKIERAFIGEDVLRIAGQADTTYDTLEIEVSANGVKASATLRLNGVWRPRRDANGERVQASGTLFEGLLKACQGKSFTETRDYINNNLKGREFELKYQEYPSASGGFGKVPMANIVQPQAAPF